MEPGVIYSAPTLAAELGMSATPVREAMHELVTAGLIETVRNRGFRVPEISEHDLDEIFELRLMLEVPAMVKLSSLSQKGRLPPLDEFDAVVREIVAAAEAGRIAEFLEADRRFHLDLLAMQGNRRLVKVVGNLREQVRLYGLNDLATKGLLAASAREHAEMLAAIREGDADRCERLVRTHLQHTRGIWARHREDPTASGA
jgi:DNA-binding GntR family transcriptional regulator